ncbi:MAG: glycosyltransferase [Alphaproteobacteria bacterium]|nr:glycosyltransferase [Alphaproteobacteria bacterium]
MAALAELRYVWRRLPMRIRRKVGQAILGAAGPLLAARLPSADASIALVPPQPSVMGVFQSALGHGTAARLLLAELAQAGLQTGSMDVTAAVGADLNDTRDFINASDTARGPLILALNPDTALVALMGRPSLLRDRPIIGYFVWELETPPAAWRRVRHALHAVWSPSRFSSDGLSRSFGVPVTVVPHPAALAPPPPPTPEARNRGLARIGAQEGDFIALSSFSVTSSLARKNPFGAIKAFEAAFGENPQRRLVLRCLGGHRFPEALQALRAAIRETRATITLIDAPGDVAELYDLYAACDVLLALHRSEGFGLNMAEAMLSERAVIATGWSGNLDFMDRESAALVDYTLIPVRDPQGIYRMQGARWAEPSIDHAVTHLRRLADNPDERQRVAAAGAAMARERLKGGAAAEALKPWMAP